MKFEELVLPPALLPLVSDIKQNGFEPGRIISEHRERYFVFTKNGEMEAEITGNLRYSAKSREDFPAVGDWVALQIFESGMAIIHKILPRSSVLKRQSVHQSGEVQVIAANVDFAFIVQAVDRDFNLNRLERYLTICNTARVNPVIVLTKTDLADESQISKLVEAIGMRAETIPVIAISNETRSGYEILENLIEKGKTYCLLGSSGVGKSTLLNNLLGENKMKTGTISNSNNKGRHVTSHRELLVLENGGIIIDNPGMREVGLADSDSGLETTFGKIRELSALCKYNNCTHSAEKGCAVIHAVEQGKLDSMHYENYLKMNREIAHFESSVEERRKKDKNFGKMINNFKKNRDNFGYQND